MTDPAAAVADRHPLTGAVRGRGSAAHHVRARRHADAVALAADLRERCAGFAFISAEDAQAMAAAIPDADADTLASYAELVAMDADANEQCGNEARADVGFELAQRLHDLQLARR